jgi:pyridoxal biosynthesis lyase PdxS
VTKQQPVSSVEWIHRSKLNANSYNPNKQAPPESRLLKISLLEDGWTQPIVVFDDGSEVLVIIDGEHRWRLSADPEVWAMTDGLVPIVRIKGDAGHRMMSTVRHNRARGEHGVLPMSEIVKHLLQSGYDNHDIQFLLQMESEEVERLAERAGLPAVTIRKKPEFGNGWVPG